MKRVVSAVAILTLLAGAMLMPPTVEPQAPSVVPTSPAAPVVPAVPIVVAPAEPQTIVVESFELIEVECGTDAALYIWRVARATKLEGGQPVDIDDFSHAQVKTAPQILYAVAPPGTYEVECITVSEVKEPPIFHRWVVTVQGERPPPIVTPDDPPVDPDNPPPVTPNPINRVTYVHEKETTPIPPLVAAGLRTINETTVIVAAAIDPDVVTGELKTPKQYEIAIAAAKAAGLPCAIIQAGDVVVKTIKAPTTKEQILDSIKP